MKRLFALLLSVLFVLALSSCGINIIEDKDDMRLQSDTSVTVSRECAIKLALDNAGVTLEEVRDLDAELDREYGGVYWEVDFEHGGYEYSYDIDSKTGEVTKVERDFD